MTRDERYIAHHKATYLARLASMRGFPAEFLLDADFRDGVRSLAGAPSGAAITTVLLQLDAAVDMPPGRRMKFARYGGDGSCTGALPDLRAALHRVARATRAGSERAPLARKLGRLEQVFALDAVEAALMRYFVLCLVDEGLGAVMQDSGLNPLHSRYAAFLARLLDVAPQQVARRLSPSGRLLQSRILESGDMMLRGHRPPEPAPAVCRIVSDHGLRPERLVEAFYAREPAPALAREDFAHLAGDLELVVRLLADAWQHRRPGTNVLLYGAPGLGKTQFARLAAHLAGGRAYGVPRADDQGDTPTVSARRMAHDVFQRLCRGEPRPVLVVDEAESLLDEAPPVTWLAGRRGRSGADGKAWLTHVLEANPLPVLWIVNDRDDIHPAVRRRFLASVAFPELPPAVLEAVWHRAVAGAGRRFRLDTATVRALVASHDLAPGHIAQAVEAWRRVTGRGRPDPAVLRRLLGQTERLCHGEAAGAEKLRGLDAAYDPALVALKGRFDVAGLERAVRAFANPPNGGAWPGAAPHQLTLLFHGPSGAGKTELAKHLAQQAGRRLHVERMSDLLSMWVGESEKNLARAFGRAAATESVLLVDEFDSLAADRVQASRRWEVSQTNELLQQIENYPGVLIACTNRPEALDPAIARRFSHKVGFAGIPAAHRAAAVARYFADWLDDRPLATALTDRLRRLGSLYPGDLRAVRQRYAPDALLGDPPDAEAITRGLEDEAGFRKAKRRIGFTPITQAGEGA